jgi:DNA-binding CsgD family transcriptional regulator/tetratricopeptide (TPR) repeat protein
MRPRAGEHRLSLLGRRAERATLEQLLAGANTGQSGALVVRGEAGIGKTALLEHVRDAANTSGFRVEYAAGVESETQFVFAGLHQLCAPLLDRVGALPDPQQTALGVAFGRQGGAAPDRFLVGLATLHLLAEVAEEGPLLCLVEDAQWLDQASAQVLAFVARRLVAERIALVFALRDPTDRDISPFAGLPGLRLNGLGQTDARALLAAAVRTPLDDMVRDRIVAEARGNPLALLELPRSALASQLAGGFELPDVLSVPRRVEESFRQRSGNLPDETQLLLLVSAGLVEIDSRVRFRHPLVRSAVYAAATLPEQRRAHRVLAAVTDPQLDPDRRAWHRAQAVLGTDEGAAAELEQTAGRARGRGGLAAAAAFMKQAAMLTPEPKRRAIRALEAAHAKHDAGVPESAMALLAIAEAGPLDALQRARLELLRAQIAFHLTRGRGVPAMLLDAARTLAPLDPALARETYLHALEASFHAGRLAGGRGLLETAEAARNAPPPPTPPRPLDLLLEGLVTRFTQGYEASVPSLRRALVSLRDGELGTEGDNGGHLWLACHVGAMLWDDESIYVLASRAVRLARDAGALTTLPAALNALALVLVLTGELARASELFAEEDEITRATGAPPLRNSRLALAAWSGREHGTSELFETAIAEAKKRGEGLAVSSGEIALAYLHNGLGNYDRALSATTALFELDELAHSSVALPELVEAAVRAGQPESAAAALDRLTSRASASGTQWALGMAARSRALTSTGPGAEAHYREAIERLRGCRMATHLARTHLVYGEWLRREGRRHDAREQLRTAHDMLSAMGAEAYAERASRELRATGEHPRKRTVRPTDALTAQELHIARLVATGATNREVGAQLFLSPRTIEAHLRSIFHKLNITSRRQIRDLQLP